MSTALRMIDIGANMTDPVFHGVYRTKQAHPDDYVDVLKRAYDIGVEKIVITGGSLSDSKKALDLIRDDDRLFCTVGCHPTRCGEFESTKNITPAEYLQQLQDIAVSNIGKVVAVGEFGLDYDRLQFCSKDVQKQYFEQQFEISDSTRLPLFLHCRNAYDDFLEILHRNKRKFDQGVVHSFTGTAEEALSLLRLDLFIGINGCSLKSAENLEAVKVIPPDRILIETDAPWCEIRPSHVSFNMLETRFASRKKERWEKNFSVKSRNEPRNIIQILEVLKTLYQMEKNELAETIYKNTCSFFKWKL